ncbi:uncharacterized protein LOC129768650 [Toxorhynchites rutilus septentrionalis]|uniref:uncharacterized protein LOC129768650 n=1 Tax=Toxorhynchites rutilus septentrionalis TaxID=329112 RepID=UPI0024786C93|nr:uncharacterized protein LOC129768650 [Toxorhynchites rutilus septentrionalis]
MTNVTVVFEYEEPEYCRLCFSEATKNNELCTIKEACTRDEDDIIEIIRGLLQIELDPGSDANCFICSTCVESLDEFYRYRTLCRQNNVILKKEAIERQQKQIELAKCAIENTNVLDQVNDGEPIKVIIRMNAEGKPSVRLQVKSKQPIDTSASTNNAAVATTSTSSATNIPTAPEKTTTTKEPSKLIRLPNQNFYFYKTPASNYGLIYGGYRFCGSVPRKSQTYWVCEQRQSHNCMTLIFVDRSYSTFFLNQGHNHEPPKVRSNLVIFKANDVLHDVIQKERAREQRLAENRKPQKKIIRYIKAPASEVLIKDEISVYGDDESRDTISEIIDGNSDDGMVSQIKEEDDCTSEEDSQSSTSGSQVEVDGGDNMYIIQELA